MVQGLACAVLVLLSFSCAPLPQPQPSDEGPLALEKLTVAGAVPMEWGNLVAVSVNPQFAYQYQLWFQDEEGVIRLVVLDNRSKQLLVSSRVIPRS
jgi:hypothetical protein